jgi:hypothetical protein
MIPEGLISYSPMELERMAAEDLRRRPRLDFEAPINLEFLLQDTENVNVELMHGLRVDHQVEGCVCKQYMTKQITVFIDSRVYAGPWAEYNEVLGEEYAHIRLHAALFNDVKACVDSVESFVELQRDPQWHRYEGDARRFSAAIRMPPKLVLNAAADAYEGIVSEFGFSDAAAIENRLRHRLAQKFRVTLGAMRSRLTEGPCDIRNQLLNSIQSRSTTMLPSDWTVTATPPMSQLTFLERPST